MHGLLGIVLLAQTAQALPPDSVETLRRRARRAEAHFEREARRLAPIAWGAGSGSDCDEIVGRFCLTFGDGPGAPPAGEVGRVVDARRDAVEAVRRYFSAAPAERSAAGPLVRLLIADERASEARSAARAFAVLSGDSLWGPLLLGLAHHAAGDGQDAARSFDAALARLPEDERRRWLDLEWLVDPAEYRRVRRLGAAERAEYERRFWLLADPFWATPSNEFLAEHMARHAQAMLLADVPVVGGMVRWGDDLTQLTVRYGVPTSRRRTAGTMSQPSSPVEYWDSAQRAFAPARLSEGVAAPPLPGGDPALYAERARATYAPRGYDRVLELTHQVSRFIRGDSVLIRVDARSEELPGGERAAALIVYDSALTTRHARQRTERVPAGREAVLFATAAPGSLIYSAELFVEGDSSRVAARARYALGAFIPPAGPVLSDLVLARPFGALRPRGADDPRLRGIADLTVDRGDTVGIYVEAYRVAETGLTVDLSLEEAGGRSLLRRLGGWIGRTLGITSAASDPRITWEDRQGEGRYVIALDLPLDPERHGMHELVLRVTNAAGASETRRRFLIR